MRDRLIAVAIILVIVALIACQRATIVENSTHLAPVATKFYHVAGSRTAEAAIPAWWDGVLR